VGDPSIGKSESNWLVIPPTPPPNWWCEPEHTGLPDSPDTALLRALQQLADEHAAGGRPLTTDEYYQYCRLRGMRDLFFLGKFILGFDRLQGDLHADLAYAWQCPDGTELTRGPAGLFRWATIPRGHLKTTLLTIAWTIFCLLRDRNERILIYMANYTLAKKKFGEIRMLLEGRGAGGAFLLDCFPELRTTSAAREKWAENALTIPRDTPFSDHSIECTGVGATITGSHFTTENVDDAIGKLENREQMAKLFSTLDNLDPLLDSFETGKRRMACTPWGFGDPAAREEDRNPAALVCRRTMFEEPDPTAPQGRRPVIHPGHFSYDKLIYRWKADMQKTVAKARDVARQTPFFWNCQFMCRPRAEGAIGFRREWVRSFVRRGDLLVEQNQDGREGKKVALQACNVFITVDPIGGDRRGTYGPRDPSAMPTMDSDYVGIAVVAVSDENMWYLVDCRRRRYNDDEFVRVIFELVGYYHPKSVHIEATAGQRHIFKGFLDAWRRGKPHFVLGEWAGGRASKEERIRGLIPKVSEGFLLFRTEAPTAIQEDIDACIDELLAGDTSQHDDAKDALSAMLQVAYAPGQGADDERQTLLRGFAEDDEVSRLEPTSRWAWDVVRKKKEQNTSMFSLGEGFNAGGANA
jgi:phage terminase large subunit-like protein